MSVNSCQRPHQKGRLVRSVQHQQRIGKCLWNVQPARLTLILLFKTTTNNGKDSSWCPTLSIRWSLTSVLTTESCQRWPKSNHITITTSNYWRKYLRRKRIAKLSQSRTRLKRRRRPSMKMMRSWLRLTTPSPAQFNPPCLHSDPKSTRITIDDH